jgi:hypothetical protein
LTNIIDIHTAAVCNHSAMPRLVDEFSKRYRRLENDQLLALALQRQQLEASALIALDSELAARSLGETALREFEDQLRTKAEPEEEDIQEQELPTPSELPDDWFDEETDSTPSSLASSRPKGVTAGAFMFWLSGIITIGWGVLTILERGSSLMLALAATVIALGILSFVAGFGLWRLNPWGRKLAQALCWLGMMWGSLGIVAAAILRLRGFAIDPLTMIYQFVEVLWLMLWALCLGSEATREAFSRASHGRKAQEQISAGYFR